MDRSTGEYHCHADDCVHPDSPVEDVLDPPDGVTMTQSPLLGLGVLPKSGLVTPFTRGWTQHFIVDAPIRQVAGLAVSLTNLPVVTTAQNSPIQPAQSYLSGSMLFRPQ